MTQPVLKAQTTELHTKNGLLDGEKSAAAGSVRTVLADTFNLLIATQGLHWNVQGPMFYSIHKLTEAQYRDMFEAVDKLAERIRSLGFMAPHSAEELGRGSALTSLSPRLCDTLCQKSMACRMSKPLTCSAGESACMKKMFGC
jgi:starvation-inducible DNA-binding protein